MCQMVGAKRCDINTSKDNWFHAYSWSESEENEFKEWLAEYLLKNKDARKELAALPKSTKKFCKQLASEFTSNYGWKTK